MSRSQSSGLAFYWSEDLADELTNFLTRRLRCPEIAADLTHETYLRIYQSALRDPPDNARALAFRIAINLANDYQRKVKVRERFAVDADLNSVAGNMDLNSPGPERNVIAQQRLDALQNALDELESECRTAFLLHSIDGLTQAEIGERLGVSRSKVARLIVKALSHLALRVERE